jgi:hypothetical protein
MQVRCEALTCVHNGSLNRTCRFFICGYHVDIMWILCGYRVDIIAELGTSLQYLDQTRRSTSLNPDQYRYQ